MTGLWRWSAFFSLCSFGTINAFCQTSTSVSILKNIQSLFSGQNGCIALPWKKYSAFLSCDLTGTTRIAFGKYRCSKITFKNICCCKTIDTMIHFNKRHAQHLADMAEIRKGHLEFMAEPYVTLEMLLNALKESDEALSVGVNLSRLKAAKWIVSEMEKQGSLDGSTLEFYHQFDHDYFAYMRPYYDDVWRRGNPLQTPGVDTSMHDYTRLKLLSAVVLYKEDCDKISEVFDREFEWHHAFFISPESALHQRFNALCDQFAAAKINLENATFKSEVLQATHRLKNAQDELEGFTLAASAIIDNVNIRMKRIYIAIFDRRSQAGDGGEAAGRVYADLHPRSKTSESAAKWYYFRLAKMHQIVKGAYCIPPDLFLKRFETLATA